MRQLITLYHLRRCRDNSTLKTRAIILSAIILLRHGTIRKIAAIANGSSRGRRWFRASFQAPPPNLRAAACKGAANRTKEQRAII